MSGSIEGTVGAALSLQHWNAVQEKDNLLLRKVLDNQADSVLSLINSATGPQPLAQGGMVGINIHVTA